MAKRMRSFRVAVLDKTTAGRDKLVGLFCSQIRPRLNLSGYGKTEIRRCRSGEEVAERIKGQKSPELVVCFQGIPDQEIGPINDAINETNWACPICYLPAQAER